MSDEPATWVDDFTADHFADGRYDVTQGSYNGSFTVDNGLRAVDGLLTAGWKDPTDKLGEPVAAYVETTFTDWPLGNGLVVGFVDPDDSSSGLLAQLFYIVQHRIDGTPTAHSFSTQLVLMVGGERTTLGFLNTSGDVLTLPTGQLKLRLSFDRSGRVVLALGGQYFGISGATFNAENLALTGELTSDDLATLANYVPMGSVTGGGVVNEWRYAIYDGALALVDGAVKGGGGSHGQLRVRGVN